MSITLVVWYLTFNWASCLYFFNHLCYCKEDIYLMQHCLMNPAFIKNCLQGIFLTIVFQELPPYNGFGSLEDSLQSCLSLVPQPPKKDFIKMLENDHKILRFEAEMVSKFTVISFCRKFLPGKKKRYFLEFTTTL